MMVLCNVSQSSVIFRFTYIIPLVIVVATVAEELTDQMPRLFPMPLYNTYSRSPHCHVPLMIIADIANCVLHMCQATTRLCLSGASLMCPLDYDVEFSIPFITTTRHLHNAIRTAGNPYTLTCQVSEKVGHIDIQTACCGHCSIEAVGLCQLQDNGCGRQQKPWLPSAQ